VHLSDQPMTLTVSEVAALLRTTPHTVGRMAKAGEIPGAFRIGTRWRFPTARVYRDLLSTEPPTSSERSES
jgi:excisionase family DNA binding protein